MKDLNTHIPQYVTRVTETLQSAGFEACLVGGCVRDTIMGRTPKDWDVTTNAIPEEIIGLFEKTFYENVFGTVGVVVKTGVTYETSQKVPRETPKNDSNIVTHETSREETSLNEQNTPVYNESVSEEPVTYETNEQPKEETIIVEVTPYRMESNYSDNRHPDTVTFSKKIEDDLKRRDFTINALAYNPADGTLIDLYNGQNDIKDKVVKAIGNPEERFNEDALRLLRAVRFSTELGFSLEKETKEAVIRLSGNLRNVSSERIRDEFVKIIMSNDAKNGMILAHDLELLKFIVPELEKGIDMEQNGSHIYTVWEHNIRALEHAVNHNWPLHIRLGALFHDIGKPETRRWSDEKKNWTFYGHDIVGARITKKLMERLRFPVKLSQTVTSLVKYHLFFSDVEQITLSAVRRIVSNVGPENVWDLMKIRTCDRIGMGRPVEKPYRLRKYEAMIEEAMRAPVSVGMLKIDGNRIMEVTHETPGPKLGLILHALLEEVLEDPTLNTEGYLEKRCIELIKLPAEDLKKLGEEGKEKKAEAEEEELTKIRRKHGVK